MRRGVSLSQGWAQLLLPHPRLSLYRSSQQLGLKRLHCCLLCCQQQRSVQSLPVEESYATATTSCFCKQRRETPRKAKPAAANGLYPKYLLRSQPMMVSWIAAAQ